MNVHFGRCRRLQNRMHDKEVKDMSISRILSKEMNKSGGCARLVKVPANRRPTSETLKKLEREISAQVSANEAMRSRSMQNASKKSRW